MNSKEEYDSYFDKLPDELKMKVLGYINTSSVINFCKAYPSYEYLSHDRDVINFVNFSKQYKLENAFLCSFLVEKPRCELITVLNINCVYWIPGGQLLKCIIKLVSLECLFAIDTKLGVTPDECMQYSSMKKLKKIGLSLLGDDFLVKSVMFFPDVIGLYFHVYDCALYTHTYIKKLINRMEKLEELWIIDSGTNNTQLLNMIYHLPPWLKKATLLIHSFFCITKEIPILTKTFESSKRAMQFSFEKCDGDVDLYGSWSVTHPIWNGLLNELHCEIPFGPKDAKQLVLKKRTLDNINFEELNFCHVDTVCCIRLQNLVFKALTLPNSKYIKKLSINFCMCDETWKRDPNLEPHKKKQKSQEDIGIDTANLGNIIRNCLYIEELEIWGCEHARSSSLPSLKYIKELKKLKSLSLMDVPLQVDGSFLIDVCKSCVELRSLKVTPMNLNTKMNINLLEAIKYATNLRDFRFEHMFLPMKEIIELLTNHHKIERLFLKCVTTEELVAPLNSFIANNPQLILVMLVVKEMPKIKLRKMQNMLNKHKCSASQLFYCIQNENIFSGRFPIPEVHQYQIIKQQTSVAVLDIFNGFV